MSGRIPRSPTRLRQKRAGRLSYLMATRPARLPSSKPTNIKPKDSRYERGTTGGQVKPRDRLGAEHERLQAASQLLDIEQTAEAD